jgi:porphobilinogen synthase
MPYFVTHGRDQHQPVASLPGVARLSVDRLLPELERAATAGLKAVMLFGVLGAESKDPHASSASDPDGPVPAALRAARDAFGQDLTLMTDVCLCAHTDHGHCGVLKPGPHGASIDNNATLPRLADMAAVHAAAGADFVSPSDMMDGRVAAIRAGLDAAGHDEVGIVSYAVKYASAFYGPFRDAAGSAPGGMNPAKPEWTPPADRKTYQMDPRNLREALREADLDVREGADMMMVKPAGPYLDVIRAVRDRTHLPVVAYHVSGEYAMLEHAAAHGLIDREAAVRETLLGIRRAGADLILSYHAVTAAEQGWTDA